MMACFGLSSGLACRYCLMLSNCVGLCEAVLRSLLRSFLVLLEVVIGALLYMANYNSTRIRRGDTARSVSGCSWLFSLRLLEGPRVHRCSWLFADGCRRSCQRSAKVFLIDCPFHYSILVPSCKSQYSEAHVLSLKKWNKHT